MTKIKKLAGLISEKYGVIKRARGPFLYTAKNVRLTDLYQEGGRAILGWGSDSTSCWTVFKNVLSRGINGSFETDFSFSAAKKCATPLSRSCSALFGDGRTAVTFSSKEKALKAALSLSVEKTCVYRPWNTQDIQFNGHDCILFAPPLAWAESYWILACKKDILENADEEIRRAVEALSTKIPSPVEAAVTRSVYDLIKAIQVREEKNWFIYDTVLTRYFLRKGPYLYPKMSEAQYDSFVRHCLDCEIVISPDYSVPSIVPFGADKGVFRKLEKSPFEF